VYAPLAGTCISQTNTSNTLSWYMYLTEKYQEHHLSVRYMYQLRMCSWHLSVRYMYQLRVFLVFVCEIHVPAKGVLGICL
jgi:hypothetical protein